MAKWFRSAEMDYVSFILNEDAAHSCINDLGLLGIVQFTDVSTSPSYAHGQRGWASNILWSSAARSTRG